MMSAEGAQHLLEADLVRVEEGVFRGGPDLVADGVEPRCILGLRG